MTVKNFMFTLNNWTEEEYEQIQQIQCRYMIIGKEVGESGTPHLQGYCELGRSKRFNTIKNEIPRAHIDKRMGTRDQARNYCMKDNNYIEIGDWSAGGQGSRNDIAGVFKLCREKVPMKKIAEEAPVVFAKYNRAIEKYKGYVEEEESEEFRNLNVEVHWGAAGTGKTRYAFEKYKKIFVVNPDESFPFDGYDGQKEILIDDFEGQMKYKHLLRVLDGHKLRLNVKGGHRYAVYNTVIITSSKHPIHWYNRGYTEELKRRITKIQKYRCDEECDEVGGNTNPNFSENEE